jgi:hypothetical protein
MPARLRPADPVSVAEALAREERAPADLKLLSKHFLAVLAERAPGRSVSTTAGGVPRVCRTPSTTWAAA